MLLSNRDNFISSFLILFIFPIPCGIPLAKTSGTMLNKGSENKPPFLGSNLRYKAFNIFSLSYVSCRVFIDFHYKADLQYEEVLSYIFLAYL